MLDKLAFLLRVKIFRQFNIQIICEITIVCKLIQREYSNCLGLNTRVFESVECAHLYPTRSQPATTKNGKRRTNCKKKRILMLNEILYNKNPVKIKRLACLPLLVLLRVVFVSHNSLLLYVSRRHFACFYAFDSTRLWRFARASESRSRVSNRKKSNESVRVLPPRISSHSMGNNGANNIDDYSGWERQPISDKFERDIPPRGGRTPAHLAGLIALRRQNLIAQMQFRKRFQRENSSPTAINKRASAPTVLWLRPGSGYIKLRGKIARRANFRPCDFCQRRRERYTQSALSKILPKINIS